MPRVTRNSAARLANANNNGSTTATTTELTAPSSVRTTRSQTTANNDNEEDAAPIVIRRSTRRAAIDAKARIAEETKARIERKRRSRRNVDNMEEDVAQQQRSPLANSLDLKPAALPGGAKKFAAQSFKSEENADDDLEEFTCAICLDKPDTLVDLATISGCTHKFCFDCIDKWAETENKCPCCKQRFNRIDRVKKLPPATPPTTSRRGKRKRSDNTNNSGSNTRRRTGGAASAASAAAAASAPRVNSRTVEDRNQQHMPAGLSFALLESIFNSAFMGPGGLGSMQAGGERGRTTFRFPVPPSMAGDGDLDDMAGMLRMILQDATIGGPSARFTVQVRRTTGPANAGGGGGGAGAAASAAAPPAAARASGGAASRASSSPRSSRGSSRASSNGESRASRQQRSTLFSYFGNSPSSRRSRSSASGAARSSSAARPASRRDSGVIDLAGSDSE